MKAKTTEQDKVYRVGFIGTGGRSVCYAREYVPLENVEIIALADPVAANRSSMAQKAGLSGGVAEYDDWRDMLRQHTDLDGVVIASPNFAHGDQAVACLERGIPIALEKPVAHTKADCERILDAERANAGRTLIGFVLRSAPFYRKAYELVRAGKVGSIVSIEAHELVRWLVSSLMMRSWWRRMRHLSGGSMLEKCCHDLDILNWLLASRPVSLNCYGGRLVFSPNPALPEFCTDCGEADHCPYFSVPERSADEDAGEQTLHDFLRDEGRCIYNIPKDTADVQTVNIEYENGAVASLLMNFNAGGSRGSRNISIIGTKGCVWGDIDALCLNCYENRTDSEKTFTAETDGSGHGGGDRRHALELVRMMTEQSYRPDQDASAGYLSAVMAIACDISRLERRRVNFRYGVDGRVDIA